MFRAKRDEHAESEGGREGKGRNHVSWVNLRHSFTRFLLNASDTGTASVFWGGVDRYAPGVERKGRERTM